MPATSVIGQLPDPAILARMDACAPDTAKDVMDTFTAVMDRVRALETANLPASLRAFDRKAFWHGFRQGFAGIGLLFTRASLPVPPQRQQPEFHNISASWWRTGHGLRCAIQICMDRRGMTPASLGLTPTQAQDLDACGNPDMHGTPLFARVRAEMTAHAASATPAAKVA